MVRHKFKKFIAQFLSNYAHLLRRQIVSEKGVLKLINKTRARDQLVKSGKIERDLPTKTSAHQDIL